MPRNGAGDFTAGWCNLQDGRSDREATGPEVGGQVKVVKLDADRDQHHDAAGVWAPT
jgi:hypothetical protein